MWNIDKTFEFCYGHRVWTQKLDGRFSDDLKCACRHLHGHEGKVQVYLEGKELNPQGMVTDFRHLEWLKKWINTYIDHQFILDKNDPLYSVILGDRPLIPVKMGDVFLTGWRIDCFGLKHSSPMFEYFDGFFVVDFPPTSENLSKWLAEIVQIKIAPLKVTVSQLDWWETPKSRSTYYPNK